MNRLWFAMAAALAAGGLWGCSWFGGDDSRDDRSRDHRTSDHRDSRADEDFPRGGPREDWNRSHSDPVCAMSVNARDAYFVTYRGRNYYFCSADCARRFRDNPDLHLPGYERPETEPRAPVTP